ncbi:unnamed protein product [Sphagnum jensenii]|uniref:Uncharacterized protein n=1 Tax=Sphagnum jensenii TaxID=128206 RepID=A0ABP1B688_9BRYO
MDQSYLHYSFMRGMQEYTDPLLTREVQASQNEARVALALLYPTSGDLIVALERVMSSTVMLFSSSGLTKNGIELMVMDMLAALDLTRIDEYTIAHHEAYLGLVTAIVDFYMADADIQVRNPTIERIERTFADLARPSIEGVKDSKPFVASSTLNDIMYIYINTYMWQTQRLRTFRSLTETRELLQNPAAFSVNMPPPPPGFIDAAGGIVYSGVTPSGIRYWEVGGPSGEAPGPPPDEVVPGPPPAEEDEKDFPGSNPGKRPAA